MLVWLDDAPADAEAGPKAARLGALARAGFPVPPGFVVTADVGRKAAAHPPLAAALASGEAPLSLWAAAPLPMGLDAALAAAYADLAARLGEPDPAVAVRSSALDEDGAGASFAGQHATYLNVRGARAVEAALRACWASAWRPEARAYRERHGIGAVPAVAVLVQALVPADVAGVAFTANPVTGERDELLVEAAYGLGEALVSGRTTPDQARLAKADGAVRAYAVGEKARMSVLGAAGTALVPVPAARRRAHALTAAAIRDLHALCLRVEAFYGAPQDLEWAIAGGRLVLLQARPVTALPPEPPPGGWTVVPPARLERRNFAEHFPEPVSPLAETLLLPVVASRLPGLAREFGYLAPAPAIRAVHGYVYARGDLSRAWDWPLRVLARAADLVFRDPRAWESHPGGHAARVRALGPIPAGAAARVAWCEAYVGALADAWVDVHRLSAGWRWSEYLLDWLLGPVPLRTGALLGGFGAPTRSPDGGPLPASFDPAVPVPGVTADEAGPPEEAGERAHAAETALALAGPVRRALLRRVIPRAQAYARVREPAVATLGCGWGAFREALVGLGADWAAAGHLDGPESVFLLEWPEVRALAAGGPAPARLAERRAEWERRRGYAPPLVIGGASARETLRAIAGLPASPGHATGLVRVVRGPEDFASFLPGEVLVAPATTPAWTPLFARAAAIVTDVGGPLSHGSIVAREYGIPAVLGTGAATRRLRTGDRVTVDGDLGLVRPGRG